MPSALKAAPVIFPLLLCNLYKRCLDLDSIFARTVKEENLDPHNIWLPLLPFKIYEGLGNNGYRVLFQDGMIGEQKDDIRRKVLNFVKDQ